MRVLVTGASGFVGRQLCPLLKDAGHAVTRVLRAAATDDSSSVEYDVLRVDGIDSKTNWSGKLDRFDVVIHLAGKAHVIQHGPEAMVAEFHEVNVEGSARLGATAAAAGVERFIFLSSIKVNGEATFGKPFTADQEPIPVDPYGESKAEAERRLRALERESSMEVVIIRPPLIYGPGPKGNLELLYRAIERGLPLPFGAVDNRRDLVSIYNLCDLISVCVIDKRAAGQTFLVSDNEPLSTPELVRHMAETRSAHIWQPRVPVSVLKFAGRLAGKTAQIDRLTEDLEVDMECTKEILGWYPPFSVVESFEKIRSDDQSRTLVPTGGI